MKIALITSSFFPNVGGVEVVIHNLALNLLRQSILVDVVVPQRSKKYLKNIKLEYRVIGLPWKIEKIIEKNIIIGNIFLYLFLNYLQQKNNYTVWHANFAGYFIPALVRLSRKNKILYTAHGADVQVSKELVYGYRLNEKYDKMINKYINKFKQHTAISPTIYNVYISLNCNPERIKLIPNGVSFLRIEKTENKEYLKNTYGFDLNKPILLTTGRNHPKKGYKNIPLIASFLVKKGLQFEWAVVGRNTDLLKEDIEKYNIQEYVKLICEIIHTNDNNSFQYPSDDLIKLYKTADLYCFPSYLEALPVVLIEAMANGLPVVCFNSPGVKDVVQHSMNGMIVKKDNNLEFANAIYNLLNDRKLYNQLSTNAVETAKTKYDWSLVTDLYIDCYKNCK